jgi:hypothetical protein
MLIFERSDSISAEAYLVAATASESACSQIFYKLVVGTVDKSLSLSCRARRI